MAKIRKERWIPKLRSKVKKMVNKCNFCKVFSTKPYGATATADMPQFRVEASKPFETTGVDFAGPFAFKIAKKEHGKSYVLLFTCATSRAVHLELTKTQTAEEFQRKLNLFIARRTRPNFMISDNASVFQVYSNLDEEHQEEREVTGLPGQTRRKLAIQPIQIPLVGRRV